MNVAIYARVSTKDKCQEVENQLRQLREFAAAQGWTIFREYVDHDYKTFTNPITDHPGDWDVALSISYPNYAALDQLAAKGATIAAKHFGSREAALERAKKLDDVLEVIPSHLAREVIPK